MANDVFRLTYEPPNKRKIMGFSQTEFKDLGIAMLVLSIAFTIVFSGGIQDIDWVAFPLFFLVAAIAVLTAFVFHELAHKFVAQKYGCWAEFRSWQAGLMMALVFSMMGFLFAAPGAVMVMGNVTKSQNGKISAAGPATNIMIATAAYGTSFLLGDSDIAFIIFFIGTVNAFIGAFNMIPFMPFDGAKIVKWSIPVYVVMLAAVLFLVAIGYGII